MPFYRTREIVRLSEQGHVDNDLFISTSLYEEIRRQYGVPMENDIMLTAVGTIGIPYVVKKDDCFYYKDASVLCLSNVFDVSPEYFQYVLLSSLLRDQMFSASKGTTVDTITIERASEYKTLLPPLREQYRIVNEIKRIFSIIDCAESNLRILNNLIHKAKSKILELAMQGKLVPQDPTDEPAAEMLKRINPNAKILTDFQHYQFWATTTLDSVCNFERGITFPAEAKEFEQTNENIACLRTSNIQDVVDLSSIWYIDRVYLKNNTKKILKVGDIIMSTANSKELVGRSVIVRSLPYDMTFGGFVTVIRTTVLNPDFLLLFFKYQFLRGKLSKIASQTTNIANLNTKILSSIEISIPPIRTQDRIVKRVHKLYSVLDKIEASLQS